MSIMRAGALALALSSGPKQKPKRRPLPPLWASLLVIPAVLFMAFAPEHGGVLAFLLIPLILGVILTGGFIASQCKLVSPRPRNVQRYANPVPKPSGVLPGALSQLKTGTLDLTVAPEDSERAARVRSLLRPTCTQRGCYARSTAPCEPVKGVPLVMLDTDRRLMVHFGRIKSAVDLGFAVRDDVVAQFGGNLPEGLEL